MKPRLTEYSPNPRMVHRSIRRKMAREKFPFGSRSDSSPMKASIIRTMVHRDITRTVAYWFSDCVRFTLSSILASEVTPNLTIFFMETSRNAIPAPAIGIIGTAPAAPSPGRRRDATRSRHPVDLTLYPSLQNV